MNPMFEQYRRIAFASPRSMQALQLRRLREHLAWCLRRSPYYRRVLRDYSLHPARFTLSDLPSLPFTTKADLEAHNEAFRAVPIRHVVDIVLSSGTTGQPTRVLYTARDLERLAYNEAQSFRSCGLTSRDVVLLTCTMDRCFVAGLAYFLGAQALGAATVRSGHATMESHLHVILKTRPTAIIGVPTFLRRLALHLKENGVDPRRLGIRRLIGIGEPVRDARMRFLKLGCDLERLWGAPVYSTYASTETITTFQECVAQNGGHLHPDLAIVEIVGDDDRVRGPGEIGEVVVTPLAVEGMPLVRFRTGDVSFLIDEPCTCGRRSPRLGPILGRLQQMLKVKGTTLYPQAVYSELDRMPQVVEYYLVAESRDDLSDDLTVHVAVRDPHCTAAQIEERLQARLRVRPRVIVEPEERVRELVFPPRARKPVRFTDRRKRP